MYEHPYLSGTITALGEQEVVRAAAAPLTAPTPILAGSHG